MGVTAVDKYCNNSARSRSDKLDSDSEAPELWLPPARRRCNDNSWSAETFIDSMASSQDARDKIRLTSEVPPPPLGFGKTDGGVTGLLNRLRRIGLLLFVGVKSTPPRTGFGLLATPFSKHNTRALTLVLGSVAASSELEESCKACWMSPVETAEVIRRGSFSDEVLPLAPVFGADLLAELIVGRMAEGIDGVRHIDPKEGDFDTLPLADWTGVAAVAALDFGRWFSPSESLGYST